jgi:hypothetical protein
MGLLTSSLHFLGRFDAHVPHFLGDWLAPRFYCMGCVLLFRLSHLPVVQGRRI